MKKHIALLLSLLVVCSVVFTGCFGSGEKSKQKSSSQQTEDGKTYTFSGNSEQLKKQIDQKINQLLQKNPFDQKPVNMRNVKANPQKYLGQTLVFGPVLIESNNLSGKYVEIVQIKGANLSYMKLFDTDFDTITHLYYDKQYKGNNNLVDISSNDEAYGYVKATVNVDALDDLALQAKEVRIIGKGDEITQQYRNSIK